jgi:RHS repeat-associated protein
MGFAGIERLERLAAALVALAASGLLSGPAAAQQLYFIHPDHLNTPRVITNQSGQAVWQWDNLDPFGNNAPVENPSGLGAFTCNLRFPGQYFDRETNLHYNYFRDYDPGIGRYVQSDPIGLKGGINTYGYVYSNPLSFTDRTGEIPALAIPLAIQVGRLVLPRLLTIPRHLAIPLIGTLPLIRGSTSDDCADRDGKDCRKIRHECIEKCTRKWLPSPTGDLQASEFHKCVADCLFEHGC